MNYSLYDGEPLIFYERKKKSEPGDKASRPFLICFTPLGIKKVLSKKLLALSVAFFISCYARHAAFTGYSFP